MADASPQALVEIARSVADAIGTRRDDPVSALDTSVLRDRLDAYDFNSPVPLERAAADLLDLLRHHAVRSDHPRYFGLFNPPALVSGIAGDLIVAAINPQLAVWSHAPAAAEIEAKLVRLFAGLIWPQGEAAGTFTGGGTEANHTALLEALTTRYPEWSRSGVAGLARRPVIYASAESHLAWLKIARACGLGTDSVRLVPTEDGLRLSGDALARAIAADPETDPVLVVATAGTTAHGAIDDLTGIAAVGRAHGAHVHVDAAWAGAALLDEEMRPLFAGIENADSVTIDPHKWLAVPMGAGLFLSRRWEPLAEAFSVSTGYMPSASLERRDAYIHSLQWSRRFTGGKLFLALATMGLEGYRATIRRQRVLGERLRKRLAADGWLVVNDTALPLVCFAPVNSPPGAIDEIMARLAHSGAAWLATVMLRGKPVLRACITSFETTEDDVDAVVEALRQARDEPPVRSGLEGIIP